MKRVFQNKITAITILILVVLNIVSLSFLFFEQNGKRCEGNKYDKKHEILKKELALTDVQSLKFDSIRSKHFEKVHIELGEIHKKRDLVMKRFLEGDTSCGQIDTLFKGIAQHKENLERLTYKYFSTLRSECSEGQQHKFDSIILDFTKFKKK